MRFIYKFIVFILNPSCLAAFLVAFDGHPAYADMRDAPGSAQPDVEVHMEALRTLTATPTEQNVPVSTVASPAQPGEPMAAPLPTVQLNAPPPAAAPVTAATAGAPSPSPATAPAAGIPNYVEVGGDYQSLTHNQGNGAGGYARAEVQSDPDNRWNGELLHEHEFHADGNYAAIGNTHTFNEDWYSDVTLGGSTDGFFLPQYRVDAFLNRKWLDSRQLVTTIGAGWDKAHDSHHDESLYLGATYYFTEPWIIQWGVRGNDSSPGSVTSASTFAAITEGRNKEHFITVRYGFGREAYQIIAPGHAITDFASQDGSVTWKQWLGEDWGFNARGELYHNPFYSRTGFTLGVFKEF